MTNWYYKTPEGEFGPVSRDELALLARRGRFRPIDHVRPGTSGAWVLPGQGLFDVQVLWEFGIEPTPEPPPQAHESDFYVLSEHGAIGPFTGKQVRERVVDGELPRDCLVRRGHDGVWFQPSEEWYDPALRHPLFPGIQFFVFSGDIARKLMTSLGVQNKFLKLLIKPLLTLLVFIGFLVVLVLIKAVGSWLATGGP